MDAHCFWQVPLCNFVMIHQLQVHRVSQTLCATFTTRTTAVKPQLLPQIVREQEETRIFSSTKKRDITSGPYYMYIPGQN